MSIGQHAIYASYLVQGYIKYQNYIAQKNKQYKRMKRSSFIKMLMDMPGEDPLITFTCDHDEVVFDRLLTDYDVTADENGNPVSVPNYIDIRLELH